MQCEQAWDSKEQQKVNLGTRCFNCWTPVWFFKIKKSKLTIFRACLYNMNWCWHGFMWLYFLRRLSQKQWCCSSNSSRERNRVLEGRGTHPAQLNEELLQHEEAEGVAHWLNTGASCFSKSEWARTRDIDEVATNTTTSVFLKKGSSTVRMTHPGSLYTMHAYELSSRLGEIGSQGKRLRNPLTNYPGESVVFQRLRGRQEAHLCKMSTLRQWFLHHTYDTRSDAGSHSQQDKTYQTVFWIYGLILVANAYVGMHG